MWYLFLLSVLMLFFNDSFSFLYHTPTNRYAGVLPDRAPKKSFEETYRAAALRVLNKGDFQLCELIGKLPDNCIFGNNKDDKEPCLYTYVKTPHEYLCAKPVDPEKDSIYTKCTINRGLLASTRTTRFYLRGFAEPFYTKYNGYVDIIHPYSHHIGENGYFRVEKKIFQKKGDIVEECKDSVGNSFNFNENDIVNIHQKMPVYIQSSLWTISMKTINGDAKKDKEYEEKLKFLNEKLKRKNTKVVTFIDFVDAHNEHVITFGLTYERLIGPRARKYIYIVNLNLDDNDKNKVRCIGKKYMPEAYRKVLSWYLKYTPYEIHKKKTTDFSPFTQALIADVENGVESPKMIKAWCAMTQLEKEKLKFIFTADYQSYLKKIENHVGNMNTKVAKELVRLIRLKLIDVEAEGRTLD